MTKEEAIFYDPKSKMIVHRYKDLPDRDQIVSKLINNELTSKSIHEKFGIAKSTTTKFRRTPYYKKMFKKARITIYYKDGVFVDYKPEEYQRLQELKERKNNDKQEHNDKLRTVPATDRLTEG